MRSTGRPGPAADADGDVRILPADEEGVAMGKAVPNAGMSWIAVLLAIGWGLPAHAAVIATADTGDGASIRLTDEMPAACNQASFHGGARIQRAGKVQAGCWAFDWKTRVFLVVPLKTRTVTEGVVQGVTRLLDGESAAAMREFQSRDTIDQAHALRMRADEFKWVGKKKVGAGDTAPSRFARRAPA